MAISLVKTCRMTNVSSVEFEMKGLKLKTLLSVGLILLLTGCANYKPYQRTSSGCLGAECIGKKAENFDYESYHNTLRYIGIDKPVDVNLTTKSMSTPTSTYKSYK